MRWLERLSVSCGAIVLLASACSPTDLQVCEPGTSWSHDLAACVAGGDDGMGTRDDSVMTPDTGAADPSDGDGPPDDGAPNDAEVLQDAEISQADAAPPNDPKDAGGDAKVQEPDASSGEVCKDGDTQTRSCGLNGRGQLTLFCADGRWHEASCDDPDECVDGAIEIVPCDRRDGRRRCLEGHWRDPGCLEPMPQPDAGEG
jgi:hypothetical protein